MTVLIVGASLAGLSTATALRDAGFTDDIVVAGEEDHLPYDRPPLSKGFLLGSVEPAELRLATDDELPDVAWRLAHRATGLSTDADGRHTVTFATGESITADEVVVATGARARTIPGYAEIAGVHSLRNLDDAHALRETLSAARHLVIIGAGFIGAEVASSARSLGVDVTIVEAAPAPLAGALGVEMAAVCAGLHAAHRVPLRTGVTVDRLLVDGAGRLSGVVLSDGDRLAADALLVGIGAVPNIEWLDHPGLDIDNGVRVDALGRTGIRGIYAVGDCASAFDPSRDRHHRSEHWTNATAGARTVAAAIAGTPIPDLVAPYFWSNQYGRQFQFAGYREDGDVVRIIDGDPNDGAFVAVYERGDVEVAVFACDSPRLFTRHRKQIDRALRTAASPV